MEPKRYPHGAQMVPKCSKTGTKQTTMPHMLYMLHRLSQVRVCSYRAFFINRASRSFWQYRFIRWSFFDTKKHIQKNIEKTDHKALKSSQTRVIFDPKSHQKNTSKRHVEKTAKKTSKKMLESDILGDKFDPKRPLDPQSPHSLQPTYFLRKNEVRVGERSPKDLPKPLREHQFSPFKKHIKKVGQKAPRKCPNT